MQSRYVPACGGGETAHAARAHARLTQKAADRLASPRGGARGEIEGVGQRSRVAWVWVGTGSVGGAYDLRAQVLLLLARERRVGPDVGLQVACEELADEQCRRDLVRLDLRQLRPLLRRVVRHEVGEGVAPFARSLERHGWGRSALLRLGPLGLVHVLRLHDVVVLGRPQDLAEQTGGAQLLRLLQLVDRGKHSVRLLAGQPHARPAAPTKPCVSGADVVAGRDGLAGWWGWTEVGGGGGREGGGSAPHNSKRVISSRRFGVTRESSSSTSAPSSPTGACVRLWQHRLQLGTDAKAAG